MTDVVLTESRQAALRALLAAEPDPGQPLPAVCVLDAIARLVPCEVLGAWLTDPQGHVVSEIAVAPARHGPGRIVDSPPDLEVAVHFRNGTDHAVRLAFRRERAFSEEERALLRMLVPVLQRLVRERPAPDLPAELTVSERRVLDHVAAGRSNAEIAAHLGVCASTVRKHLENAYRKLGVTNRTAAVARLQGRDRGCEDLQERLERFA